MSTPILDISDIILILASLSRFSSIIPLFSSIISLYDKSSTALNCTLEYLFENSPDKTLTTFGIIG